MKRDPSELELEKISQSIAAGDRIEATSLYMSITGCGLTGAQEFVGALASGHHASKHEKLARKQPKRRCFGIFKVAEKR
jgi:hypothetical protein